jgi:hypothetical protein
MCLCASAAVLLSSLDNASQKKNHWKPAGLSAELPGDAQDGAQAPASDIIDT